MTELDYVAVGAALFTNYPETPPCAIEMTDCAKKHALRARPNPEKGGSMVDISLDPSSAALQLGDTLEFKVMLQTIGSPIQAAGVQLSYDPAFVSVTAASVNETLFDVFQIANITANSINLAGVASSDVSGTVEFASFEVKSIAGGDAGITIKNNLNVTNFADGTGFEIPTGLITQPSVSVRGQAEEFWMIY